MEHPCFKTYNNITRDFDGQASTLQGDKNAIVVVMLWPEPDMAAAIFVNFFPCQIVYL